MNKSPVIVILLVSLISFFTLGSQAQAAVGVELRNGDAFSGKNGYYKSTGYYNNASYTKHKSAYSNAVKQLNAIPNTSITLHSTSGTKTDPIEINMYSVNTSNYDWYGHAAYSKTYSTVRINEKTCKEDGFTQANYNKVALHELGHSYYAVHQHKSVSSVMKQGKYAYSDYTTLDKSNFKYQYK